MLVTGMRRWLLVGALGAALGILYCVLMTDLCLDLVGARGPCIVEGSFVRTSMFASTLAALRRGMAVLTLRDGDTPAVVVRARTVFR